MKAAFPSPGVRPGRGRRWVLKLLVSACVLALSSGALARDAMAAPGYTVSRYMHTTDTNITYAEGCHQAQNLPANARVVLDFGQPWWNGSTYGTIIFGSNTFRSISQIQTAVDWWLYGFWVCSSSGQFVKVAVGTNNYHGYTTYNHGVAWENMIDRINAYINAPPSWASRETARGANDMEMSWNTPSATRAWVNGYSAAFNSPSFLYDYGDAGGCPPYGSCNNGWTQEDVYWVSWGATPAYPLPEIYCEVCYSGDTHGGNSRQWYRMSLYAYVNHGGAMYILGSFTQWAAAGYCCTNTPAQGWNQLYNDLNSDSRTAQGLESSTDITKTN